MIPVCLLIGILERASDRIQDAPENPRYMKNPGKE
jgi:hypothetical protein